MLEELHQLWVAFWPLIAVAIASGILCSFATWWRIGRRGRADYRRGCSDTDRLWTNRIAQDKRDDAPLMPPVSRSSSQAYVPDHGGNCIHDR